jgi:gas vesicle protein
MSEKDMGSSFGMGFVIGAIVGVAIGFLYAPKPGTETRTLLRDRATEVADRTREVADKTREVAGEARKRVEDRLGHHEAEA